MKTLFALSVLLVALAAPAQSTNASAAARQSVQAQTLDPEVEQLVVLEPLKPNQIVKGRFVYSGIAIQAFKTRRPLQLLNPLASVQHGSPEDNITRDPTNGKVTGLKIFAIRF